MEVTQPTAMERAVQHWKITERYVDYQMVFPELSFTCVFHAS
jgi:hypothetical protein